MAVSSTSGSSSGGLDPSAMAAFMGDQTDLSNQLSDQSTQNMGKSIFDKIKNTMMTGMWENMASMAEGIAKTMKATGEAIKGLA